MEHLALEILPREKNGTSQYAWLPENASISITDTSEIFDKGNLWSHDFQLNIPANAHIFGTAGEMHGSRLHEQIAEGAIAPAAFPRQRSVYSV